MDSRTLTTKARHVPAPPALYATAHAQIRAAGLLKPRPWTYLGFGAANLVVLAGTVGALVRWQHSWWAVCIGAIALAVVSTQIGFLGHDVAHRQVTRRRQACLALGLLHANLLSGLSYRWWTDKHNAHHAHPNDLDEDPDVQAGALVFDVSQAGSRTGWRGYLTRNQAWLFFPMLLFEALNLYIAGLRALLRPGGLRPRTAEIALIAVHSVLYVGLVLTTMTWVQGLVFVAVHQGLRGLYLGLSFAPNHKGMPTLTAAEQADPFLRQVLSARNIRGGAVVDVALGGLNYQIEHHLFPSMPRANLRRAQQIVRPLCAAHGVPYSEMSAPASYREVVRHLYAVGTPLRRRNPA